MRGYLIYCVLCLYIYCISARIVLSHYIVFAHPIFIWWAAVKNIFFFYRYQFLSSWKSTSIHSGALFAVLNAAIIIVDNGHSERKTYENCKSKLKINRILFHKCTPTENIKCLWLMCSYCCKNMDNASISSEEFIGIWKLWNVKRNR